MLIRGEKNVCVQHGMMKHAQHATHLMPMTADVQEMARRALYPNLKAYLSHTRALDKGALHFGLTCGPGKGVVTLLLNVGRSGSHHLQLLAEII